MLIIFFKMFIFCSPLFAAGGFFDSTPLEKAPAPSEAPAKPSTNPMFGGSAPPIWPKAKPDSAPAPVTTPTPTPTQPSTNPMFGNSPPTWSKEQLDKIKEVYPSSTTEEKNIVSQSELLEAKLQRENDNKLIYSIIVSRNRNRHHYKVDAETDSLFEIITKVYINNLDSLYVPEN